MSWEELKSDIASNIAILYDKGLVTAYGGNLSARLSGAGEFLITPTHIFKGALTSKDMVKCSLDNTVLEGSMKPSFETPVHAEIYRRRFDVNAIIHAHNPIATGLAISGLQFQPVTGEGVVELGEVPILPYRKERGANMAQSATEVAIGLGGRRVIILKNHGVFAVGRNLLEARLAVETVEHTALTMLAAKLFGRIETLPKEEIDYFLNKHKELGYSKEL